MNNSIYIIDKNINENENIISTDMFFSDNSDPIEKIEDFFKNETRKNIFIISRPKSLRSKEYFFKAARNHNKNLFYLNTISPGFDSYFLALKGINLENRSYDFENIYLALQDQLRDIKYYALFSSLDYLEENNMLGNIKKKVSLLNKNYYIISCDNKGIFYTCKVIKDADRASKYFLQFIKDNLKMNFNFNIGIEYKNDRIRIESEEYLRSNLQWANLYRKSLNPIKGIELAVTITKHD